MCIVGGPGDDGIVDAGSPGIGGMRGGGNWAGCIGGGGKIPELVAELPFGRIGGALDSTHGGGLGRLVVVEVCDADMH